MTGRRPDGTGDRRERERRGRGAETIAALFLRLKGYRIVARRVRTPAGEIDLVARRRGVVAFVEVKARQTEVEAAQSISRRQRARIVRAAGHFLAARPDLAGGTARFDAVLVSPRRLPRHLISAWTESAD
jgi:putative endonuclease